MLDRQNLERDQLLRTTYKKRLFSGVKRFEHLGGICKIQFRTCNRMHKILIVFVSKM